MNEIRRRDRSVFLKEALSFGRLLLSAILVFAAVQFGPGVWGPGAALGVVLLHLVFSYRASVHKRFYNLKLKHLWKSCEDRLKRFRRALDRHSRQGIARFEDLPKNVDRLSRNIYAALRRADIVLHEVTQSEGWLVSQADSNRMPSEDRQAQELYRLADKNIAEYRQNFQGVIGGVQRTEAQAAVFVTTLDNLRLRLLSQRLGSRQTEEESQAFLEDITEARMQLDSIDKALEELEMTPFPRTISVIPDEVETPLSQPSTPPEIPEDAREQIRQNRQT